MHNCWDIIWILFYELESYVDEILFHVISLWNGFKRNQNEASNGLLIRKVLASCLYLVDCIYVELSSKEIRHHHFETDAALVSDDKINNVNDDLLCQLEAST